MFAGVPMLCSIIWFEKFGSDAKRTILNKLVGSVCASALEWCFFVQMPELARYLLGPMPSWMCLTHTIVKNSVLMQMLIFFDCITVFKYLFVFRLRNPGGFLDDFWTAFINIWVFGFCILSQFTQTILPNSLTMNYFFCTGENPVSLNKSMKVNFFSFIILIASLVIQLAVPVRIHVFKRSRKIFQGSIPANDPNVTSTTGGYLQSLSDFTTNSANVIILATACSLGVAVSRLSPKEANDYPNYLLVYAMHLAAPVVLGLCLPMTYFMRHKPLRTALRREVNDHLEKCERC